MKSMTIGFLAYCAIGVIGCATETPASEPYQTEEAVHATFAYHAAGTVDEVIVPSASSLEPIDQNDGIKANDVFQEFCTIANGYNICITYNFTSRTAAANVQNQTSRNRSTHIRLRNSSGTILAQTFETLTPNEFRGVFKSGINAATYCSEAQEGSGAINGICHVF
jgi:hypothetical protein